MMVEHLLASYAAWLLACGIPVWFASFLYRTTRNTIGAYLTPSAEEAGTPTPQLVQIPPRPAYEPSIHLPTAA
jgi:hypothetical protein